MIQPTLIDFFDLANGMQTISQEAHTLTSGAAPSLTLHQVPKVAAVATNLAGNVWQSASETAGLLTVQVYYDTAWHTLTPIGTPGPLSTQVYCQLADSDFAPYSPRLYFHTDHAGRSARVSYTGMGSVPLASYFRLLLTRSTLFEQSGGVVLLDAATWNNGLLDGGGTANKTVIALPAATMIIGTTGDRAAFPGLTFDCGASGNAEVAAFTTASAWKRILLQADHSSGVWSAVVAASAEAATQGALTTPTGNTTLPILGWVDVQNNGTTGSAGAILAIPASQVTAAFRQPLQALPATVLSSTASVYGSIIVDQPVDVPLLFGVAGTVTRVSFLVQDSGDSGSTTINVLACTPSSPDGTTIFSSTGDRPSIASNTHAPGVVNKTMATAATADTFFKILFTAAATNATNARVTLTFTVS